METLAELKSRALDAVVQKLKEPKYWAVINDSLAICYYDGRGPRIRRSKDNFIVFINELEIYNSISNNFPATIYFEILKLLRQIDKRIEEEESKEEKIILTKFLTQI